MQKAQEVWRSKGAIGKLHNLVKAIRYGPQRMESFKKVQIGETGIDSKSYIDGVGGRYKIATFLKVLICPQMQASLVR